MEEKLENLLYINEDLFKEKNELRKIIYEKIIYIKDYKRFRDQEHFLFEKAKELFEDEEFTKLTNKYYNLDKLTEAINFYNNMIKNKL